MIEFTSTITATLVDSMGTEQSITDAARVSLDGIGEQAQRDPARLIHRLYKERHGVPFEHVELVFHFACPIFVSRQIVKHRLSSINEISGRYVELKPKFYLPEPDALLGQSGKAMDYQRQQLSEQTARNGSCIMREAYKYAWSAYEALKFGGYSNEQARAVLPTATFTELRMKANLRSWLNFVALRVDWPDATTRSHPQAEIQVLGEQVADTIAVQFPNVWAAFKQNGYQAV